MYTRLEPAQSIIFDALTSAAIGRMVFPAALNFCKHNLNFTSRTGATLTFHQVTANVNALLATPDRVKVLEVRGAAGDAATTRRAPQQCPQGPPTAVLLRRKRHCYLSARTGAVQVQPDAEWLARLGVTGGVPARDAQLPMANLTVPTLAHGFPEELGGR